MDSRTIFRLVLPPELRSVVTNRILGANSVEEIRGIWAERAGILADRYDLLVRWEHDPGLRSLDSADFSSVRDTWCERRGFQVIVPWPKDGAA